MVHLAICVPARNEEQVLGGLLSALAELDMSGIRPVVCFYLDHCADGTEGMLRAAAGDLPYPLRLHAGAIHPDANAGRARRAAMALGARHVGVDGILLTTDADSRPRRDWVQAAVRGLRQADAIAGRIVRAEATRDPAQTRLEHYYDALYRYRRVIDPVPWEAEGCHHFSGGANLGFRASAYAAIGGFRAIPSAEDATALDDAARAGLRVRRDPAMVVETSSRRQGRAPGGLAAALRGLDAGEMPLVPHPAAAAWQYRWHSAARRTYAMLATAQACDMLGRSIGLTGEHVLGVGRDCPNAEAFAMRIVPSAPHCRGPVPLAEAEDALAELQRRDCEWAA